MFKEETAISKIEAWQVAMPYKNTMTSSRGSLNVGEKVILRITCANGTWGVGEASVIFPARDGESASSVFARLRDVYGPALLGQDAMATARILQSLARFSSEQYAFPSSLCAIDLALHDLKARQSGMSVAQLLGGASRTRFALSCSMSTDNESKAVSSALRLADLGYRLITLKGSTNWRADITHFLAVRHALPDNILLEIDPNQAWNAKAALEVDRALQGSRLACIEQPCAWWDLEAMQFVTERAQCPIAADESVINPADAMRVARMRAADMITIKLAKSGGIRASAAIVEIATAAGLQCNMGSKHTLGVGTAALLHFAAAYPEVGEFIGYGSAHERFVDDIIREDIRVSEGHVRLPEGPGFGVTLDESALTERALAQFELIAP